MRTKIVFAFISLVLLLPNCENKYYYETDPRFFNDAMHGDIVGKVIQTDSKAMVVVSQVYPVDSVSINPSDGSFEIRDLPIGNYDLEIRADDYRIYKRSNVMIEGAGTTYIGEIDLSTIPDLVASHYPEDRAEVVFNNQFSRLTISMTFTRPMDRESVEAAFSTDPPTEGIFYWGQYSTAPNWIYFEDAMATGGFDRGATITTYSKITSLSYQVSQKDSYTDTTYIVRLSTEAKDTSGNQLRFPLEYSFSTVQSSSSINGIITVPSHGDVDVDLLTWTGIRVTFPRNMDESSTEEAIDLKPESDVIYLWPAQNQLTIYTGGAFHADETYEISIDSTAKDLDGIKLGKPFSFSFSTASVGVNYTQPNNGELFVSTNSNIRIAFNTYMVKSSVKDAISISPEVSGTLDWDNNSKTMLKFNISQALQSNTKYTVTIGTGARDIFGTSMKEPYIYSFVTRPE